MPRNVFFSQAVKSEQSLYEDLVVESLQIYGQDIYYVPRTLVNRDSILGEDPASKFDDAYLMEAYIENIDGFEGAGDLMSKFGLEIRDEATFVISKRVWERLVGKFSSDVTEPRPNEGDVIFLPMTNSFFEINHVESESPFFQLSNVPVYRMQCSLFEYSDEDFDTGIEGIDSTTGSAAYQVFVDVTVSGGNHFEVGETVSQLVSTGITVTGEVQQRTKTSNTAGTYGISNIGVTGSAGIAKDFIVSGSAALTGAANSYTGLITKIYDVSDNTNTFTTDGAAENVALEFEADSFMDFTESNPFGDPSDTY
jgi:hypothetical protein